MPSPPLLAAFAVLAVGLRLAASSLGFNYDLASYALVARILEEGGNVYAETHRYNYGPIWFHLIRLFTRISELFPDPALAFRTVIPAFLSLLDLGIAALLLRRFGSVAALVFLFHPVSILVTGYHRQFEGLALVTGLLAALAFEQSGPRLDRRKWLGLGALSVSLVAKHILFAFPLWLAVKERTLRERLLVLFLPPALFFASFLPYWSEGGEGIVHNVFLYRSIPNAPLLHGWLPRIFVLALPPLLLLLGALIVGAGIFRKLDASRTFLFYCAILVAFSPAIENQYLVIAVPFVAVYRNPFTVLFGVAASLHLLMDRYGLELAFLQERIPAIAVGFHLQVGLLTAGIVWATSGDRIRRAAKAVGLWCIDEVRHFLRDDASDPPE